jgi:hypothetical protein
MSGSTKTKSPTRFARVRLAQAPLALALALAIGQPALLANASVIDAPSGAQLAERLNTGLHMGDHKAAVIEQFKRRNPALAKAPARPATTITVANCDDSGTGSLREAFTNAVTGDTIDLSALTCSTITLTSGSLSTAVDDLTVHGPGAAQLAIDGGNATRLVAHAGYGLLSIDGVTLRNGTYDYTGPVLYAGLAPGACVLSAGSVTIANSAIDHCSASGTAVAGAAIDARGRLILTDSTVTGTTAAASSDLGSPTIYGGAIYAAASYLTRATISGATITATTPTAFGGVLGGGIFSLYGVVLTDSLVTGVSVDVASGKIAYAKGAGIGTARTVIMSGSTVTNNSVRGTPGVGASGEYTYISAIGGGGVYIASIPRGVPPESSITNSTISGNSATCNGPIGQYTVGGGGGVVSWSVLSLTISNSTVSGNSSDTMGGGLYTRHGGTLKLANATVSNNTAPIAGGIADQGERATTDLLTNSSIVAGNHTTGTTPAEIVTLHGISGTHNLIGSANVTLPVDTLGGDPMLAPLTNNGGPTPTHALLAGSPAIDAGSNDDGLTTDQRGEGRTFGTATDIGAFEAQPQPDVIFANGFE